MRFKFAIVVMSILFSPLLVPGPAQAARQFDLKWGSSGAGTSQFLNPFDVAVDPVGQVYVVDEDQHRVQKFQGDGTFILAWGTQGSGAGQFEFPKGIAVDKDGNVYVADSSNNRIQKFDGNGTFLLQWGTQGSGDGQFILPRAIEAGPDGSIYVAEDGFASKRVQKFTAAGVFVTKWGSIGNGDGQFSGPRGIAVDGSGFVYVTDTLNDRIQKFTSTGAFVTKWGVTGAGNGQFSLPIGVDCRGSRILVVDSGNARVQEFDTDGTYQRQFGSSCLLSSGTGCTDPDGPGGPLETGDGQFNGPRGIAIDRLGQVFVVDGGNDRIQKFRDPLVVGVPGDGVPGGFRLLAAPNPFGPSVQLVLELPHAPAGAADATVTARILDVAGREVRRLWEGMLPAGEHHFAWDGRNDAGVPTPTGLYFAVVELDGRRAATVKLVRTP